MGPKMVAQLSPFVQRSAQNLALDRIYKECSIESVDLYPMVKRFTFEVAANLIYGPMLDDKEREYFHDIYTELNKGFDPMVFAQGINDPDNPDNEWAAALRAKDVVNQYLQTKQLEMERLTETESWDSTFGDNSDCLARSMLENDAIFTLPHYTIEDRADFMLNFVFAAFETTAGPLTNMIYTMWQNPEETEKVRKAIMAHPELSNPETIFTFEMLKNCNAMECFIKESMRMHSFLSTIAAREVHDEDGVEIGGYHLPKGTGTIIPSTFLMSGEGSWTDPMEFRPSRFDKSNGESKADRGSIGSYNHIPFATGLHKCLGQHLAMMEMRMYTTLLLRDWEFELDESKFNEEGTVNHKNLTQSFPHYI